MPAIAAVAVIRSRRTSKEVRRARDVSNSYSPSLQVTNLGMLSHWCLSVNVHSHVPPVCESMEALAAC